MCISSFALFKHNSFSFRGLDLASSTKYKVAVDGLDLGMQVCVREGGLGTTLWTEGLRHLLSSKK